MQARLAFGILLALGLAELAVLNLHLAPQLAAVDVPTPVTSNTAGGTAPVKASAVPIVPSVATVATPPAPSAVAAVSATTSATTPLTTAPSVAVPSPPTSASAVAVTPPTPTAPEPRPVSTPKGEAIPDLLFSLDSHLVGNPTLLADLRRIAGEMKTDASKRLLVRGHSDSMGGTEYKRQLSLRRAVTVQGFLVSNGVPADRVSIEAASDSDPADPGNNPVAWAKNRRVQVLWR